MSAAANHPPDLPLPSAIEALHRRRAELEAEIEQVNAALRVLEGLAEEMPPTSLSGQPFWQVAKAILASHPAGMTGRELWEAMSAAGVRSQAKDPVNVLNTLLGTHPKVFMRATRDGTTLVWRLKRRPPAQ